MCSTIVTNDYCSSTSLLFYSTYLEQTFNCSRSKIQDLCRLTYRWSHKRVPRFTCSENTCVPGTPNKNEIKNESQMNLGAKRFSLFLSLSLNFSNLKWKCTYKCNASKCMDSNKNCQKDQNTRAFTR